MVTVICLKANTDFKTYLLVYTCATCMCLVPMEAESILDLLELDLTNGCGCWDVDPVLSHLSNP